MCVTGRAEARAGRPDLATDTEAIEAVVYLRLLPHHRRSRDLVAELCRVSSRAVVLRAEPREPASGTWWDGIRPLGEEAFR